VLLGTIELSNSQSDFDNNQGKRICYRSIEECVLGCLLGRFLGRGRVESEGRLHAKRPRMSVPEALRFGDLLLDVGDFEPSLRREYRERNGDGSDEPIAPPQQDNSLDFLRGYGV